MESPLNAQQLALNNPIILTEILTSTVPNLRKCRLVCHFWNDIVLSLPTTRLAIKLNHDLEISDLIPFFDLCLTLNDARLAKRVKASTCELSIPQYAFASKLTHFCDKFTNTVQILEVSIHYQNCLKSLLQILQNLLPNLKQLRISCKFGKPNLKFSLAEKDVLLEGRKIPVKASLTLFSVRAKRVTPFLTDFVGMVVAAAPNLKGVILPWGVCPDFGNSPCLEELKVEIDGRIGPRALHVGDEILAKLGKMLDQVRDRIVALSFGYVGRTRTQNLKWFNYEQLRGFRLSGERMPKLRKFRNEMTEVFECADFLRNNIGGGGGLKTLEIGNIYLRSRVADGLLQGFSGISSSLTTLVIMEVYEPKVLDGLGAAFPNLVRFEVDTYHYLWQKDEMKLDAVLAACGRWGKLKHLKVTMPQYPYKLGDFIRTLWDAKELYKGLKTLKFLTHDGIHPCHDLNEGEADLFKELLIAMNGMDEVTIDELYFSSKSEQIVRNFMTSSNLSAAKFRLIAGDSTDEEDEDSD